MTERVVPMIHVPDVRATADWYESIGFTVDETYGDGGEGLSFAILSFGTSQVMFNQGGEPSTRHRREVDLYVYTNNVDDLYARLKARVDIEAEPNDTFYGMREFIIRDLNRFWITFGQTSVFEQLMNGVRQGDAEVVRAALKSGDLKPETLTAALATALSRDNQNVEIHELLKQAGSTPPPEVSAETLRSYVGKYVGPPGIEFNVSFKDGSLFGAPGQQEPLSLMAIDQTTFRPTAFDNYGIATFNVEAGVTTGCTIKHGDSGTIQLKRVEEIAAEETL
jgi:uncharacterized glyoxalase superfamily protein PhnB